MSSIVKTIYKMYNVGKYIYIEGCKLMVVRDLVSVTMDINLYFSLQSVEHSVVMF